MQKTHNTSRLRLALLTATLFAVPALPAWAADIKIGLSSEVTTIDPHFLNTGPNNAFLYHIFDTLTATDRDGKLVPSLAEAWRAVDDTTWEFTLRKGVKFHNGREMVADDVVASLQRWMEVSPRGKVIGKEVASLTAKDAYTVELALKTPYAPLLSQLALPTTMAAVMAKESIAPQIKDFIGTGPYKLKERKPDQYTLLTRFDGYTARKEPASGYAGKREALIEELRAQREAQAKAAAEAAQEAEAQAWLEAKRAAEEAGEADA